MYVKAEAGNIAKLGDNSRFGVKTTVGAQYILSNQTKDYYTNVFEKGNNSPTWHSNDLRGYGEVTLTYNSPSFKAGIGIKGGVKSCSQAFWDGITLAEVGTIKGTEYAGRTTKGFVTPTFNIEAGKKLNFCLNASLDEFNIGGKLYF